MATIAVLTILTVTACQPATGPSPQNTNPWLDQVSQNSPILIANEVRLDDAQFNRLAQTIQPLASILGRYWHSPESLFVQSIARQLTNADDWRSAGLDPNGFWAVYADNEQLIARIPLLNETAFWDAWLQLNGPPPTQKAHPSAPETSHSHQRVVIEANALANAWLADQGRSSRGWLIVETQQSWLSVRLQETHPDEIAMLNEQDSMASSPSSSDHWSADLWRAFNQTHGLDGKVSAYVDLTGLMAQREYSDMDCQQAWTELGAQMPRLIMGTQDLSTQSMTLLTRLILPKGELDRPMPRPRIDVSEAQFAQVAGLGLIVDVATTRQAMIDQLQASQAALEDCVALSPLQPSQRWARGLSNRPVPPIITSIEGVMMRFDGLAPKDSSSSENHSIDQADDAVAHYLTEVHMQNPQFLIGLAGLFAPELAAMDLRANRPPQPLPPRLVEALGGVPIYLSTTEASLRVSSADVLDEPTPETDSDSDSATLPWASGAIDFNRLDELMAVMQGWPMAAQGETLIDKLTDWSNRADISRVQWRVQPTDEGIDLIIHTQH